MKEPRYYTTVAACSCPDWQYRGRERACKHVLRLKEAVDLIDLQRHHNEGVKDGSLHTGDRDSRRVGANTG